MYKNILVPVLFDNHDANLASYEVARALAAEDAKFTVMHVMEAIPSYAAIEVPEEVLAKGRQEAKKALVQTAEALPGAVSKMISGHAGRTIVDYAKEHEIDCIVMASHRPGFSDIFLGSTASRVVRHAQCAVHVIR